LSASARKEIKVRKEPKVHRARLGFRVSRVQGSKVRKAISVETDTKGLGVTPGSTGTKAHKAGRVRMPLEFRVRKVSILGRRAIWALKEMSERKEIKERSAIQAQRARKVGRDQSDTKD
jgi:hypothetical protein